MKGQTKILHETTTITLEHIDGVYSSVRNFSYIIDLIHTKTNTRYLLHSNEGVLLKHPSGKMKKSFGDRSFSVAAPTLWNALPVSLRSIKCISTFKSNLKTNLFKLAFNIS